MTVALENLLIIEKTTHEQMEFETGKLRELGRLTLTLEDRINNPLAQILFAIEEIDDHLTDQEGEESQVSQLFHAHRDEAIASIQNLHVWVEKLKPFKDCAPKDAFESHQASAARPLSLVVSPYPPYVLPPGHPKGLGIDVDMAIAALNASSGKYSVEVHYFTWDRCLQLLREGHADFTVGALRTEERDTYLDWSEHYALAGAGYVYLVTEASPYNIQQPSDLKEHILGVVEGYAYPRGLAQNHLGTVIKREGMQPLLEALLAGECDVVLLNAVVGYWFLAEAGLQHRVKLCSYRHHEPWFQGPRMAFSKLRNHATTINDMNQGIADLYASDQHTNIMKRYIDWSSLAANHLANFAGQTT